MPNMACSSAMCSGGVCHRTRSRDADRDRRGTYCAGGGQNAALDGRFRLSTHWVAFGVAPGEDEACHVVARPLRITL